MNAESKYWKLALLNSLGDIRIVTITEAQLYFERQFSRKSDRHRRTDLEIQRTLVALKNQGSESDLVWGDRCLRCYISHQIKQACDGLGREFGFEHGFSGRDLYVYVLDDTRDRFCQPFDSLREPEYKPLSAKILETFDPEKASLSTWTTRYVKQNKELKNFLLEREVVLISNWAILNNTNFKQVKRILAEYHTLTPREIKQMSLLLMSYQDVYRRQRLENGLGRGQKCQIPNPQQLEQIAKLIEQHGGSRYPPEEVLSQLEQLAKSLREYRIHVRSKRIKSDRSLDDLRYSPKLQLSLVPPLPTASRHSELLSHYRQQFETNLQTAIAEAINQRLSRFKGDKATKTANYFKALELYYCQGKSMKEIAPTIDLENQYQVTRLLKLKDLLTDIRQKLLLLMGDWILNQSQWIDPELLQQKEQEIKIALSAQIDSLMSDRVQNRLAQGIAYYLNQYRNRNLNCDRVKTKDYW